MSERAFDLYYNIEGSGKSTLVFIPGMGGTTRYWEGRLGSLKANYRTILVDPLGFGRSPKPWTPYTVNQHVDALHQTLQNLAPFTLVGHSMGTLLSIAYSARYPEQVDRLILIGLPFYGGKEKAILHFREGPAPYRWFLSNLVLAALACMTTRRLLGKALPYLQPDLPKEVAEDVVKHSWRSFTSSLWEVIYNYDPRRDAMKIEGRIPVLCIHGDQDDVAPMDGLQKIAKDHPSWKLKILPGADHHPFLHHNEECLQAMQSFLAAPSQRTGPGNRISAQGIQRPMTAFPATQHARSDSILPEQPAA